MKINSITQQLINNDGVNIYFRHYYCLIERKERLLINKINAKLIDRF